MGQNEGHLLTWLKEVFICQDGQSRKATGQVLVSSPQGSIVLERPSLSLVSFCLEVETPVLTLGLGWLQ